MFSIQSQTVSLWGDTPQADKDGNPVARTAAASLTFDLDPADASLARLRVTPFDGEVSHELVFARNGMLIRQEQSPKAALPFEGKDAFERRVELEKARAAELEATPKEPIKVVITPVTKPVA